MKLQPEPQGRERKAPSEITKSTKRPECQKLDKVKPIKHQETKVGQNFGREGDITTFDAPCTLYSFVGIVVEPYAPAESVGLVSEKMVSFGRDPHNLDFPASKRRLDYIADLLTNRLYFPASLTLDPPRTLILSTVSWERDRPTAILSLSNRHRRPVAFKAMVTAPKSFTFRPNYGSLAPAQSLQMLVTFSGSQRSAAEDTFRAMIKVYSQRAALAF